MAFDRRKMRFEVYKTPEQKAEEARRPPPRRRNNQIALMAALCLTMTASSIALPEMGSSPRKKRGW